MPSQSTVPAVVDALMTLVDAALPEVTVIDGEPLKGQPRDFVAVAFNQEGAAIGASQALSSYAMDSPAEEYDVVSEAVAWTGGADASTVRTRAYVMLSAVSAALLADSRLGGACMLAQLTDSAYLPSQTSKGALAVIRFTVHVQAQRI